MQWTALWPGSQRRPLHTLPLRLKIEALTMPLLITSWSQVRFALSSSPVFSRTDTVTDSEQFYNTTLNLFEDVEEQQGVNDLLTWLNQLVSSLLLSESLWICVWCKRHVFLNYSSARRPLCKNSALARIKEKCSELRAISTNTIQPWAVVYFMYIHRNM